MSFNDNQRFIILCPFYNTKDFIVECYESVLIQDYNNWIVMFGDDKSFDGTSSLIPMLEPRFIKYYNQKNLGPLGNTINLISKIPNPNSNDILVILDGDDKLLHSRVLSYLLEFYQTNQPLLTYGQYINSFGNHGHARPINGVDEYNELRYGQFFMSHIRTWRYKTYELLVNADPNLNSLRDNNNEFFKYAGDVGLMYSLAEVAGYENIKFNPELLYWYRLHGNNENRMEQIKTEQQIKNKQKLM
jgi:glycosyltransferase involved in cell wall biosynthesis